MVFIFNLVMIVMCFKKHLIFGDDPLFPDGKDFGDVSRQSNLSPALSFLDPRERNLSKSRHGQVVCGKTLSIVEVNSLPF